MQLSNIDIKLLARARAGRKYERTAYLLYPCLILILFGLFLLPPLVVIGGAFAITLLIWLSIATNREARKQERAIRELIGELEEGSDE